MTIIDINVFGGVVREEFDASPFFTRIEQLAADKEFTLEEAGALTGEVEALSNLVLEESLVESRQEHLLEQVAVCWQRVAPFIKLINKQGTVLATIVRLVVQDDQAMRVVKNKFIAATERIKKVIIETLQEMYVRAERTFRFKNFKSAKPLYSCLHRFLPENEAVIDKLGDIALAQERSEEALSFYTHVNRHATHIKKAHCFRILSKKEDLTQELATVGFFEDREIKNVRDVMILERLLDEEKYDEVLEKSQTITGQPEWVLLIRLRVHLEVSDENGTYFFEQYPALFKEFRALDRHCSFRCRTEDTLVNIFSFVELAADQGYRPFLGKLFFERLLKKSPDFFSSDEHQEVILDRMQRGFEELQEALKKGEAQLAAFSRLELLTSEQKVREGKIVMRQLTELLYGGINANFPGGVIARLRMYDEIMGDFLERTESTSMRKKFAAFDNTFSSCVYAFSHIQEKTYDSLLREFSSQVERNVDSFEWLRDTLNDIKPKVIT